MKITAILYKSNTLANGDHPIVLRISQDKERKYVFLNISCSIKLWDSVNNTPRKNHPNRKIIEKVINQTTNIYRTKLLELELISQQKVITPSMLVQAVKANSSKEEARKVFFFCDQIIDRLLQVGKVGSAAGYKDLKRCLKLFTTSNNLLFSEIDQTFLNNYEIFLRKRGLAETSMAIYFRTLRALFNKAIKEKLVSPNYYPFKEFSVSKFNTATRKRAFTLEEMKKMADLKVDPASSLWISRLYFLFGYYGQGINFLDTAKLQWKNLENDYISYTRSKTGRIIKFKLFAPAKAMIEHYRPLTGSHLDNYIFPILDRVKHITPMQIHDRVAKVRKKMNSDMRQVAKLAVVEGNPTSYTYRHTYATAANDLGAPVSDISKAMGHKRIETTQIYINQIDTRKIEEINKKLLLQ